MSSATLHTIDDYESLLVALQDVLGVVVPDGQRSNLLERIDPLLLRYKLKSLASLAQKLQEGDADVRTTVLDVISHREPTWMLSSDIKKILRNYVFSQLPHNARIWVVGCGQGQLAYSIAMEMTTFEHRSGGAKNHHIFATDILQENIAWADEAKYSMLQLSTLSDENTKLYVTLDKKADNGQVRDKIRQRINFYRYDITDDLQPLDPMDLIICPDELVYFSNGVKTSILQQIAQLLNSGGIFLTAGGQIISAGLGLERVEHAAGLFYRQVS
ncbi:MAG: hypothetical protein COB77_02180 [Gammaproteobacteria bacterium]|nr:MAG: hypothetical protein COB77_02180 [Gammaproteobacteria bacterium]